MRNIMIKAVGALCLASTIFVLSSFIKEPEVSYKCMIQMTNYTGEKAYVVVTLINPKGQYEKTLYVQGDDEEWFPDLKNWWKFSNGAQENIDAITGATIGNGERNIISLGFNASQIDAGYKVRFESAVENQEYHSVDAEIQLNSATIKEKVEGKGYIRYIRMVPNR
ncbi:DUF2271 domain-containing protein [Arenibacter sp. M-2]|uniref:DUF2271 domain-containing protein n=1 Tax=unclassified Arenibacter TaxID=2615047 RepID=UPI000D76E6F8|nr:MULTISPECIES: DUF2271 domain-containing protein [unclassified Arenibacter]MDL5513561.1 DUF2271 domain-containing protein [Arenibacter sp. M-2]PXX23235.1 uncharacterized protein DUF2271 [Arenibacter sp. ARW7G5Y1]